MLRTRAAAGVPTARITGHSLRAGHATSAALAGVGVGVERIAARTRHRRIDVLIERYIRPIEALRTTASHDLGRDQPSRVTDARRCKSSLEFLAC